jgi:hypothetical protein
VTTSIKCPGCGANASGRFCNACGTPLSGAATCPACRQPLQPGARFCRQCGTAVGAGTAAGAGSRDRQPWIVAGAAAIAALGLVIAMLVKKEQPAAAAQAGPAAEAAAAPAMPSAADLAAMSPKERYDRLYNRVMRAAESGDQATVEQFSPMAKMAYAQLDSIDTDARYHMALLMLHTGEVPGAAAMADTILLKEPGHLFGYMIQGTIARFTKDQKALGEAYGQFRRNYDGEIKKGRQEYGEHERSVTDFKAAADAGA